MRVFMGLIFGCLLLTGCGYKTDLTLPEARETLQSTL